MVERIRGRLGRDRRVTAERRGEEEEGEVRQGLLTGEEVRAMREEEEEEERGCELAGR